MAPISRKRQREDDDNVDPEGKIPRLEGYYSTMDRDQDRFSTAEDAEPTWDDLAAQMQRFGLIAYPPPPTVEDAPEEEKNQPHKMQGQEHNDVYRRTNTNRCQNFNNFISKAKPEPMIEKEMRDIQAEMFDDNCDAKNDCNLLADLRTLHQLDRADRGTHKLLDEETVAALQQGFQSIYGMTLAEAVKLADGGPFNVVQEVNVTADGTMRRCWWNNQYQDVTEQSKRSAYLSFAEVQASSWLRRRFNEDWHPRVKKPAVNSRGFQHAGLQRGTGARGHHYNQRLAVNPVSR
ncbi:putative transporter [Venturia nashicola]|nr:putative transporter [Venturia nashicola]